MLFALKMMRRKKQTVFERGAICRQKCPAINTIVFLFSSLQAKADVRRDYGAFIASKYRFRSAKKTACKHDYFRPVILCCYTDFLTPRAEKNNILTNNPFVVVSGLENILLEITALTSTLLLTRKA